MLSRPMKLIFCTYCKRIRKLTMRRRICSCRRAWLKPKSFFQVLDNLPLRALHVPRFSRSLDLAQTGRRQRYRAGTIIRAPVSGAKLGRGILAGPHRAVPARDG